MKIKWAELHTPLFLGGTNLQSKLDPHKRTGLEMEYDRSEKELIVRWNGETAIIPTTNVASMIEGEVAARGKTESVTPPSKITAQVSTPQDHVFAGAGHGKTGK